jgi:enamine deaminase RidA (YjgF/YER057c/UK114 family)
MPSIEMLDPDGLGKPLGQYSHISRVRASEFLFIAGQVGTDRGGTTPADFEAQCALVFANLGAALASQGASFANIVEFTTYLVHAQDIAKFMQYRARVPALVRPQRLSAQHAAHHRSAGAGGVSDRG